MSRTGGPAAPAGQLGFTFGRSGYRVPATWPIADARPVPDYIQDALALGQTLSILGKAAFNGIRAYAEQHGLRIEGLPADTDAEIPPGQALHILHNFLAIQFPLLHPTAPSPAASGT